MLRGEECVECSVVVLDERERNFSDQAGRQERQILVSFFMIEFLPNRSLRVAKTKQRSEEGSGAGRDGQHVDTDGDGRWFDMQS